MHPQNQPIPNSEFEFQDWGLIDYQLGLEKQLALVEKVAALNLSGVLVFCSHPPIVTLGRATEPDDLTNWQGSKIEVSRGGRATYHGPSQLLVYPIVNLKLARKNRREKEVVGFLRDFEKAIVETLGEYGLSAIGKSLQKKDSSAEEATGVWVGAKKIASLGLAVKKWVTYHGAAINLENDATAFQGLKPCGFQPSVMTNLEATIERPVNREAFKAILKKHLQATL